MLPSPPPADLLPEDGVLTVEGIRRRAPQLDATAEGLKAQLRELASASTSSAGSRQHLPYSEGDSESRSFLLVRGLVRREGLTWYASGDDSCQHGALGAGLPRVAAAQLIRGAEGALHDGEGDGQLP